MSESIVRKVQPFTIGTRLSIPAVSKCQDFAPNYLQSSSLDNCTLQHSLNSLYLSRTQVRTHRPHVVSPVIQSLSPVIQEDMAAEDHLNQNVVSAAAASRSIKKITISGHKERAENKTACVFIPAHTENNNNNNNVSSASEQILPRIVGVTCENTPSSQFKVLIRKEGSHDTRCKVSEQLQITLPEDESQKKEIHPVVQAEESLEVSSQDECFTQRNSLFNREVLQAEAWIQGKLQDLRDSCNVQRCSLQDRNEFSQTLQRDLKDFENTLIQLNQMGEELICNMNPTSELVKRQLSQLQEQWQTLKQTAARQTRAVSGARHLQDFNTKVEKLEAWIREKQEEQPSMLSVLGGSVDKVQLTKRILDLKQDEQLYRNLYEEINHLALNLEKQGKPDGKNIASRRKHINKMYTWSFEMNWWLKVQTRLKNYHEHLRLALEVSLFYQQADNVLLMIHNMRKRSSASKDLDKLSEQEIRDIASQIMILDGNVSKLSNLHPALAEAVTRKQTEVKETWALLHKILRTERPALPSTNPAFSREEEDPVTSPWEQCTVGTELQRTMGKEVKEEQNRLKGFVGTAEAAISRTSITQSQEQESANHSSSPTGEEPSLCANDVTARHQLKGESRKPRAEPKPAAVQPGHPPLHIQLQKFTVSADKTLSWLKDNVHMATQVCSIAGFEGLDAARRCQQALEQEILNNRARMEVVKREGRELVRAQHPGSSRIEEFVGQLEVLWEELRRRHQRNALFLQASEELGFRVVKVLQALGSLDAWLESVELSMKESSLATDPETMSVAERQSCLLEREVTSRGPELSALRLEVERLHGHSHPLTRGLCTRLEAVETKYQQVHSALTLQSSELQDTRMLAEFLERVELEEGHERNGTHFNLGQPLHSEMSPTPTLMDLRNSASGDPLLESMGDPVEELREAVEMLNDTVRERGRSQNHDQAIRELLSKHASLAVHVEESLCRAKDLGLDILERQTDMAVQCEPDRCGLKTLWERQDHQEMDCEVIREEVNAVESLSSHLQELCPERVHVFEAKIRATLQAWTELGLSVEQNKSRLREFVQLQDFFRSYLRMISWTEDTRSCIFSDTALHHGKDGKAPMAGELDLQIEQKFEEFEELAATGRNILDKDHHLSQMVKERMDELRSMLGWISVHWRAQKQQWLDKLEAQDNVYSVMCSSLSQPTADEQQNDQPVYSPVLCHDEEPQPSHSEPQTSFNKCKPAPQRTEDGYEVMKSVPPPDTRTQESPKSSVFVLKDKSSPGLGNTVNLILSFGKTGDSQVQVLDVPHTEGDAEPVCRVSTYLHVKENNLAAGPVYESITLPRQKSHSAVTSSSSTFMSSPPSSPSAPSNPSQANHGGSASIFSSLKRIGKKKKRKRDARRHTIQKIMGIEEREEEIPKGASQPVIYDTRTWPLKRGRRKPPKSPTHVSKGYMKNSLLKDIENECTGEYNITPYAVSAGPKPPTSHVKTHCRFLSLGSVLSFDLPKDMTLIPSIQDIITIAPPDSKKPTGDDPDPHSQRQSALSSFKQTRPALVATTSDETATNCLKEKDHSVDCAVKQHSSVLSNEACSQLQAERGSILNEEITHITKGPNPSTQLPIYINRLPAPSCHKHECLSVHTLIKDLNGHKYHQCVKPQSGQNHSQATRMVVNLKSTVNVSIRQDSVDSGVSSLGSIKLSSDVPCSDSAPLKGIAGNTASLDRNDLDHQTVFSSNEAESVHVDHQQFEEVEEELEGIWGENARNSFCSDIMYQSNQETLSSDQPVQIVSPSPSTKSPAVFYRHLVTASAPNLLVAEFKLPSSVQSLLGYDKTPKHHLCNLAVGERRSWAAFPNTDHLSSSAFTVNETASDPVKLPEIDSHRYIYQYREEEEEEEHTGCSKDSSLTLDLAHVNEGENTQQRKFTPTVEVLKTQDHTITTRGRCMALSGRHELQTMEGALDRKQRLQLGGKKASSRGWSSCHAVLYRHTLCFYQDKKDTLRSSLCGLPLNLIGAECVPAPEYTKKPNCFHLRLRDGSEYLLNTSSRFMMKKWIMRIQANTERPEVESLTADVNKEACLSFSVNPSESSGCPDPVKHCGSSQHEVTSAFPGIKPRGAAQTTVVLREFTHMSPSHLQSTEEQCDPSAARMKDDDDDVNSDSLMQTVTKTSCTDVSLSSKQSCPPDGLSVQQRSHSFTSATYQKISPVSSRPGGKGVEKGSNYCVTLLLGDKSQDVPSIAHCQPPLLGVAEPPALRYCSSLPRPRNKSVFKKFFGRKDY